MDLDADKRAKLRALLNSMPGKTAAKLMSAVEKDQLAGKGALPHQEILNGLRSKVIQSGLLPKRAPTPMRVFARPFEMLLIAERSGPKQRGRIARDSIPPVWEWVSQKLFDHKVFDALAMRLGKAVLVEDDTGFHVSMTELHAHCAQSMLKALAEADADEKIYLALAGRLGGIDILEDARDMARCIDAAPALLELSSRLPRTVGKLSQRDLDDLEDQFDTLSDQKPRSAVYLLFLLLARLEKSWSILRLIGRLSRDTTDRRIIDTELALVGGLVIDDLEECGRYFQRLDYRFFDPHEAAAKLSAFAQLSSGITRELGIRKEGDWGKRIFAARREVSGKMSFILEKAGKDILNVMPYRREGSFGQKRVLDVTLQPDPEIVTRVLGLASLMETAAYCAAEAAISAPVAKNLEEMRTTLYEYSSQLLSAFAVLDPAQRETAQLHLEVLVRLYSMIASEEEAEVIRRRGNGLLCSGKVENSAVS